MENLKQRAEVSIQKGLKILLEHLPHEEIIAIYVKGSYVHGSMNEKSDVDLIIILKSEALLPKVYEISDQFGTTIQPPFGASAYTLEELRSGVLVTSRPKGIPSISGFVKNLDALPLLWGARPEEPLFRRTDKKDLQVFIRNFNNMWFPDYESKKLPFEQLLKAVFWFTEAEQRVKGIPVTYSWQAIVDSVNDKNHIVHDALRLRLQGATTPDEQSTFIAKLKAHLVELQTLVQ